MADKPSATPGMQVDPALVRQLAELLDDTNLTEIEVQDGDRRIRVARHVALPAIAAPVAAVPAPVATPAAATPAAPEPAPLQASDANHPGTIRSPMVGTAYLASEPGAKPLAGVGDRVEAGATLLIVEAMKVMNAIISPRAGTVTAVFVENAQPVEFDQPLIVVD